MRILNRTDTDIRYEIKGGPMRMTMSTCDLLPGEDEDWTSPYRRHTGPIACEVWVTVGEQTTKVEAIDDATVTVVGSTGAFEVTVEG